MADETEQQYDSTTGGTAPTSDTEETPNPQAEADVQPPQQSSEAPAAGVQPVAGQMSADQRQDTSEAGALSAPDRQGEAHLWENKPQMSPEQSQAVAQRAAEHDQIEHGGSKIRHAFEAMAGGPQTSYKWDDTTGELKPTIKPLTRGQILLGILGTVLGGMGAGANAKNPADAIGKGFQYGKQQAQQQDEQAKQQATDDWKRRVQTVQTNFQINQNKQAAMKLGWDAGMDQVKLDQPLYKTITELEASGKFTGADGMPSKIISKIISGSDFQAELAKDPDFLHKYTALKIDQEWDLDPKTGKPYINDHGDPAINSKYAIVDPNALVTIPKELRDQIKGNVPEDWKVRVGFLKNLIENQAATSNVEHGIKQLSGKEKDTTSDRAEKLAPAAEPAPVKVKNASYQSIIETEAKSAGVDAGLVSAIINVENKGNTPDILGPKTRTGEQAVGLMQVMPSTAAKYGVSADQLKDPKINIQTGIKILNDNLKAFGGDQTKAVAAYHAGIGAVQKANGIPNTTDGITKTSDYVNQVLSQVKPNPAAAKKELASGLDFADTSKDVKDLSLSAKQAFAKLGASFDAFRIPPGQNASAAMKARDAKKISAEDYGSLVNLVQSADGKFEGDAAVAEDHRLGNLRADVEKKRAETKVVGEEKKALTDPQVDSAAEALLRPGNLTTLKDIGGMAGGLRLSILTKAQELAKERGIPFDMGVINHRVKYVDQYEAPSGSAYKNRNAINNMMQHGADLVDINNDYRRSNVQVVNTAVNKLKKEFGDATYVKYKTTLDVLKGEARLFFAGGYAPTADQEKAWDNIVSDNATPAQIEAFAKEITNLGLRRADTFNSQYKKNMGHDDPDMITPSAREAAKKLIGTDAEGQALRKNLDKFSSGGEYGREGNQPGFQPGQIPQGNGQKMNPADPTSKAAFEAAMKASGDDPAKAKQMLQDAKWVF